MKCINCGKDSKQLIVVGFGGFKICQQCEDVSLQLTNLIRDGIEVKYNDGTKETFRDLGVEE